MGFTSIERPDVTALDVLISNWGDLPVSENERKKHTGDRYQPLLPLLKKYRKSIKNGCVTTQYEYSEDSVISGRQFARSPSLQGLKRWVRHTIATGYHDYDIVNCHPNIFVQYCSKKGWDTGPFEMYLTQRDSCLQELMDTNGITRDEAKTVVLSILNGGSKPYNALAAKPTWLTMYKLSVEVIQKKFMSDPENASIVANVKSRKTYNIGGSVMNHVICNVENSILMKAIELLRVKEPVLVFDGFMVRDFFGPEDLKKLQGDLFEATGYNLTWIEKPMTDGIDLSGFSMIGDETEKLTDKTAFAKVIAKYDKFVKRFRSQTLVYNEKNGLWMSNPKDTLGLWFNMCQDVLGDTKYGTQVKHQQTIFNLCLSLPDETEFFAKGRENRLGKLLYEDCVWNIETGCSEPFNHEYFFKHVIPRKRGVYNENTYNEVFNLLFVNTQSDENERNELWKYLSVAATGRNNKRCMVNNIGLSGTGKSTLMNAFINAFPGYADSVKMSSFIVTNFTKANDHNDDLLKFEHSRWLFTSEQTGVADCELIKSCTGGDFLNPRGCGVKTEKPFCPESLLFTMSNQPLKFNKQDPGLLDRIKPFYWKNQFKGNDDDSTKILETIEGFEALDHIIQKGYDLWKKEKFKQVASLDALKDDIKGDRETFEDIFACNYVIGNPENKILTSDVYPLFETVNESEFNIKRKFNELGVECKRCTVGGIKKTYFIGLVKKGSNEDK